MLILWFVLRSDTLETDWSQPLAWEALLKPAFFLSIAQVATVAAQRRRGREAQVSRSFT